MFYPITNRNSLRHLNACCWLLSSGGNIQMKIKHFIARRRSRQHSFVYRTFFNGDYYYFSTIFFSRRVHDHDCWFYVFFQVFFFLFGLNSHRNRSRRALELEMWPSWMFYFAFLHIFDYDRIEAFKKLVTRRKIILDLIMAT